MRFSCKGKLSVDKNLVREGPRNLIRRSSGYWEHAPPSGTGLHYTVCQHAGSLRARILTEGQEGATNDALPAAPALRTKGEPRATLQGVPMASDTRIFRWAAEIAGLGLLLISLPASAQDSAPQTTQAKGSSLEESLQSLAEEVKQLHATVQELRVEISRSRQETSEIRGELQEALARLGPTSNSALLAGKGAPTPAEKQVSAQALPSGRAAGAELESLAGSNQLREDMELLQAKVDEQHQTKVESTSKYRMKLSGIALLNLFGNLGTVDNQDVPNLALPRGGLDSGGSFGATVRQSELGFEVYGPTLAGAKSSAALNFDFFGGFSNTSNGVASSLVRLRTATMRLDWPRTSLVVGQDAPFFSPLSPTSFASLAYPAFSYAGNLWTWTPQVRVEHRVSLSETSTFLLQAGLLDPLSGMPPPSEFDRTPQPGEASRQPAYASRLAWTQGERSRSLTLGLGGYYSRQYYGGGRTLDAWAGTADWNVPMGNRLTLSGEFYRGRGLGGLGAAQGRSALFSGPATSPASDLAGLDTIGGWTQLKFKASAAVEFNAAYGQDNPFARDLRYFYRPTSYGYTSVSRNQGEMFNIIYRPRTDLLFAFEYRHLNTLQITSEKSLAGQLNLSVGVLF